MDESAVSDDLREIDSDDEKNNDSDKSMADGANVSGTEAKEEKSDDMEVKENNDDDTEAKENNDDDTEAKKKIDDDMEVKKYNDDGTEAQQKSDGVDDGSGDEEEFEVEEIVDYAFCRETVRMHSLIFFIGTYLLVSIKQKLIHKFW